MPEFPEGDVKTVELVLVLVLMVVVVLPPVDKMTLEFELVNVVLTLGNV